MSIEKVYKILFHFLIKQKIQNNNKRSMLIIHKHIESRMLIEHSIRQCYIKHCIIKTPNSSKILFLPPDNVDRDEISNMTYPNPWPTIPFPKPRYFPFEYTQLILSCQTQPK